MTLAAIACTVWLSASPALPPSLDAPQRRAVLLHQLETEEQQVAPWYWTWGLGWSAVTVFNFASWAWSPETDRPSIVAWGISSAIGAVLTLALRPSAFGAVRRAGDGDGEKEWLDAYEDERFARSIWQHLAVVVLNAAPFLVMGLGYHRWDLQQWLYLGGGLVLSEIQIATFPQLLRRIGVH